MDTKLKEISEIYEKLMFHINKTTYNRYSQKYLNNKLELLEKNINEILTECKINENQIKFNELQKQREEFIESVKNKRVLSNEDSNTIRKINEQLISLNIK